MNDLKRWLYGQSTCFASLHELIQILRTLKSQILACLEHYGPTWWNRQLSAAGRCLTSPRAWHTLLTYKVCTKYLLSCSSPCGQGRQAGDPWESTHPCYITQWKNQLSLYTGNLDGEDRAAVQTVEDFFFFTNSYWTPFQFAVWLDCPARPTKWRSVPCSWRSCQHTNSKYLLATVRVCCHTFISALCNSASKLCPQKMCTSQHRWMFLLTSSCILQKTKI